MTQFRLGIEDGRFCDGHGRQVVIRGINCAGDSKLPSEPATTSYDIESFYDGDNVTFHNRPFPLNTAHEHFARIRKAGYNSLRYIFTWEAIEAKGPGIYDEQFIQHTIDVLRVAKQFGFYVFMDPHQDVWSRYCGGSGAPLWTIYACGLNPEKFAVTEAAIVQNTYPDPDAFPKMIWSTNYWRLAAATIFTMFFGGRDFTPKCIINGINIQDFLQGHFIAAVSHLNRRIREAGDLHNVCVVGWESMNEPNRGLVGYEDITVIPKDHPLKKGTCPTIFQTILNGSGRACEVEVWDMGGLGPTKVGNKLVDPKGESAWLPADFDESRYNYTRDPGWKLGECIWAQHGVWDPETDAVLKKDYFSKNPRTGKSIDYPEFTDTYFMDFFRLYKQAMRKEHDDCIVLMQYPTLELPPQIKGTADEDHKMAFTPHFYDGITLMTKKWNRTWNVDVVGVLRGRYLHPALAVRIGETAIRNCFKDQLATLRKEGIDRMGNYPCLLSEFGIPYDMDDKHAYKTGDYSSQVAALDANYYGVEGALLEGHCLWTYTAISDHPRGDQWNGEDLSIFSRDDLDLPINRSDTTQGTTDVSVEGSAAGHTGADSTQTLGSPKPPATGVVDETAALRSAQAEDATVMPSNLQQTLSNDNMSAEVGGGNTKRDPLLQTSPGYRAAEAFTRPTPTVVAGKVLQTGFDLRACTYTLKVNGSAQLADKMSLPTVVFLPEFHFPRDECEIVVSSGKWEITVDDGTMDEVSSDDDSETASDKADGGIMLQRLRWWHGEGEQTLRVTGMVRKMGMVEGTVEEASLVQQCQTNYAMSMANTCSVM